MTDLIHTAELDFYGKQLASAGSDRRIKIFEVVDGAQRQQTAELVGHDGPIWQVAWAHPEFGNVLASCSYDRQVFVWKEHSPQHWVLVHKYLGAEGSVNSLSWAPREFGLRLACASSDESVAVLSFHGEGQWSSEVFTAHKTGVNAVGWAPAACGMRLVTGGCDNLVKIWAFDEAAAGWLEAEALPAVHTDWVRDVAWAPTVGGAPEVIASCSQDKKVAIWTRDRAQGDGEWRPKTLQMPAVVWSVSWSVSGGILAAAGGDNQVTLWRETATGEWTQIGQL
eukprot:CAMPEP_0115830130 /NCGR_PEP_ID=MMETSP0287-20121206/1459_1 /TAXON_ID=412157 /ORGANISM="Chrysochromulina rotalis, Strain UIO044" /LENGTH=280 /DNA_ID=CAMNT_0003283425 /DNA_START=24 /DNA_END=863 /DNA_ORIENTATION=+